MTATWFTSDTHFLHPRCAEQRGFASVEEHDAEVIRRWNETVGPADQVWHTGDVGMGNETGLLRIVDELNGDIHLVLGNHDAPFSGHQRAHHHQREWLRHFATLQAFARRRIAGHDVLVSHFPYRGDHTEIERYPEHRLHDTGKPLLHGHVHGAWRVRGRQINVGLDQWDLRPVSLDTLAVLVRSVTADTTKVDA